MSNPTINETILKYEAFVNDVLKEDLKAIEVKLQYLNSEIADLIQQRHTLKVITNKETHPSGFKTQLNLGCNFFMEASVSDTTSMLINIGLNHFLEFSAEEAVKYLNARIKAFEDKAEELINKSAETKAHIKLMLFGIHEAQSELGDKAS